ncbi:DUF6575 domain-containing protein [Corallococcus macrosporus]|uniref:DUF6575 domain-containing protein n=1 Tax=Corallococcus macrosporus DSM 14697 TaxID=1189310 RepID=A0A250K163_9BACT|nr:hypothetical protein MYMAC_005097 [Corallococcus macrosporus DSM 14697]
MYPLPLGTTLGRLKIVDVLDYYDGPKTFSAQNAAGVLFLAFWADETDAEDHWIYVPISADRLRSVRRGELPIHSAIVSAEDGFVYFVKTSKTGGEVDLQTLGIDEIDPSVLPPPEDVLDVVDAQGTTAPVAGSSWIQRVVVEAFDRTRKLSVEEVFPAIELWARFFNGAMDSVGVVGALVPVGARPGSFILDLEVEATPEVSKAFQRCLVASAENDSQAVDHAARSPGEAKLLEPLLAALAQRELELRVEMVTTAGEIVFRPLSLSSLTARRNLARVRKQSRRALESVKVPQADDLGRVFQTVKIASQTRRVTAHSLGVVHRQVNYYLRAARILGFLNDRLEPTSAGEQLLRLADDARLTLASMQFEVSDCGSAWIRWASASTLQDLSPETAKGFLLEMVPDLSEGTVDRRAKTLSAWLEQLKPYHYTLQQ